MAKDVEVKFTVSGIDGSIKDLSDLVKALNKTEEATEDLQDQQKESAEESGFLQDRFNDLKTTLGKLKTDLKNGIGVLRNFTKSTSVLGKVMKTTLLASGIGLVLVAITALISYFRNSEEGSRKFKIALETLGIIAGNIADFFANLGEKIVWAFTSPKEALLSFGRAIKQNIENRIMGMLELLPALGKAISLAFSGKFKEAAKTAGDAVGKVVLGVENVTDKVAETFENVVESVSGAVEAATTIVDTQRALRDSTQSFAVENAKLNKYLEEQKKIAEDTTRSYEERKAALEEVGKTQVKLAANLAKQAALEEQNIKNQIAIEGNYEKREELETQLADATAARIDAETALSIVELEASKLGTELDLEELERKRGINDALAALRLDNIEDQFEKARQELDLQEKQAIEELRLAKATEEQITAAQAEFKTKREKLAKEESDYNKKLKEEEEAAKLDVAAAAFSAIAEITGEQSAIGKAAAIAATTISTYKGAMSAFADTPGGVVVKSIAAGIAVATGLNNIRKIVQTKTPGGASGGTVPSITPPRVNTAVGAGNVLSGINTRNNVVTPEAQVTRTYVVASDVTSAQEANKKVKDLARL